MARTRIDMLKLKEILRLGLGHGRSQREIADALGVGKTTVQEVLARAGELGFTWDAAQGVREYNLVEKFYPRVVDPQAAQKLPHWPDIFAELKKKGVTLSLIWQELREENPSFLSYSRFCVHYRDWQKLLGVTMRQEHKAGEKLFLDFAGPKIPYIDLETNEIREASVFVAVLGASSYTFALATADQSVPSWIHANRSALEFLGGVPEIEIPDNLKAAVTTPSRWEPKIHAMYLDFARHYGVAIIPARPRKPRDKAKVEVGVQVVERWIMARLRKLTFTSVAEINRAIAPLLEELNRKVMRHIGKSRIDLFLELEKPVLRPLPPTPFEMVSRKKAKVSMDYHIELMRSYYSVPYRFVGKEVEVRFTASLVEIFCDAERIAIHRRTQVPGGRKTEAEHMPSHHRAQAEWTPERFLRWANEAGGENTRALASEIMGRMAHPEQGFRSCRTLIRLTEQYGKQRVDQACAVILQRSRRTVVAVENLLKSEIKLPTLKPKSNVGLHENIRGADYYN